MSRTILHCDLNNFYASVECLYRPELRGKSVAVGGDVEERREIILAKNQLAKAAGVKTGEAIWQAEEKCRGRVCVPPDYRKYLQFSSLACKIYSDYTDRIEAFGILGQHHLPKRSDSDNSKIAAGYFTPNFCLDRFRKEKYIP